MIAATADRPTMQEPESCFSQPIIDGPTKSPRVATLLVKESPPNGGCRYPKRASTNPNGLLRKAPPIVKDKCYRRSIVHVAFSTMSPNGPSAPTPQLGPLLCLQ
jgi:hypothetical protein